MKPLLVTRPKPDAETQAARLRALGLGAQVEPLLRIEFLPAPPLDLKGISGLIVTSGNALRALERHPQLDDLKSQRLFAVGDATAALARKQGFFHVLAGPGDAASLAALVARECAQRPGTLLHLSGERRAFDMRRALSAASLRLEEAVLYRTEDADDFSPAGRAAIGAGNLSGVLLMSPATARVYARLIGRHGLAEAAREIEHFCLSPAVAAALDPIGLRHVNVAEMPKEDHLLALVSDRLAN
ncbi:MAG: uroporphyrinogen-III synthase [Pseudomonadota bacterium]|nr:uroporphyrinogen-III synthase [Pseudomonadota bacterium]